MCALLFSSLSNAILSQNWSIMQSVHRRVVLAPCRRPTTAMLPLRHPSCPTAMNCCSSRRTTNAPAATATRRTRHRRAAWAVEAAAAALALAAAALPVVEAMGNANVPCQSTSVPWHATCPYSRPIWICDIISRPLDIRLISVHTCLSMRTVVAGKLSPPLKIYSMYYNINSSIAICTSWAPRFMPGRGVGSCWIDSAVRSSTTRISQNGSHAVAPTLP